MRTNGNAGTSRGFARELTRRALALLLILAMTLAVFPPIDLQAAAQIDQTTKIITFDGTANGDYVNRPIVINKTVAQREGWETASDGRYKIQITGTPYSVTVQGMTNVDIIFDNVTIDRTKDTTSTSVNAASMIQASKDLGWNNNYNYIPTCPFLLTDGAEAVVSFLGDNNVFKAHNNGWYVDNTTNTNTTLKTRGGNTKRGGYAGIQVEGDCSLTILGGTVEAWGAFQNATSIEQAIRLYPNAPAGNPSGVDTNNNSGGAGIGGGVSYDHLDTFADTTHNYTVGTPGNITIDGGIITAIGGFQAAGIGGGVNSAASTGKIIINGEPATAASFNTQVTAIGGYWSAGIGDGDSSQGKESKSLTNPYSIIINGGKVTAYGGTAAAGIGTTDELSNYDNNISGLTIELNGGDITAVSGYAQGGNGASSATAAIGAGEDTAMAPYSISIAEGTFVKASSFSKYAISNNGLSQTAIPETVVDPNTYMYLAYYAPEIAAKAERKFTLYEIKRTEAGDFMVVVEVAEKVLGELTISHVYFGYEESTEQFYLVDAAGTILDPNGDGERDYLAYNESLQSFTLMSRNPDYDPNVQGDVEYILYTPSEHNQYVPSTVKALKDDAEVSYYFIDPAMKTFYVPARYTAVAMTLYDPTLYGGKYILHVPAGTSNTTNKVFGEIYAVIEKKDSGESSGELKVTDDGHFELDKNKKPGGISPGNGGVIPDETSNPLTDLIVSTGNTKHLGKTNATVTFAPGTKSYELWLPLGTTRFDVAVYWDTADRVDDIELMIGTSAEVWDTENTVTGHYAESNIAISVENPVELWITKTDIKDGEPVNSIRYKVEVNIKSNYQVVLTDPAKTYDGHEIKQGIDGFLTGDVEDPNVIDIPNAEQQPQYSYSDLPNDSTGEVDIQYRNGIWSNDTTVSFRHSYSWDSNTLVVTTNYTINNTTNSVQTKFTCDGNGAWSVSGGDGKATIRINWQDYTFVISRDATGVKISSDYDSQTLLNFSWSGPGTPEDGEGTITKEQAEESATNQAMQNLNNSADALSGNGQANYLLIKEISSTVTLSRGNNSYGTATVTKTEKSSGTISVTVARALAGDSAELLAQATDIRYTYEKIKTPSGTEVSVVFDGDTLPVDAGTYRVDVKIVAPKFEASGERVFVIKQKPTTILAIENWRYYLDDIPDPGLINAPIDITYDEDGTSGAEVTSGAIRYDGVLEADRTDLRLDITVGGYPKMYFTDRVAGEMAPDKIIIYANLPPDGNYTFADYPDADSAGKKQTEGDHVGQYLFDIAGQVSYRVNGAMFGKYAGESPWYKFYPVTDLSDPSNYTNALWMDAQGKWLDKDGVPGPDDTRIDYHSPDNQSHAEYLYFHTVNEGAEAARYAVDITYGSLSFSYTKTIWDVNNLHYAEAGRPNQEAGGNLDNVASIWSDPQPTGETVHGKALYSNSILIENRSNRPVWYEAIVQLDFHHTMHKYNENMDEETIKHQDNVLARLFYTYYNESNGIYTVADAPKMVHTGNTGYATTGRVVLPAVTPQAYTSTLTEAQLRETLPYSLLEMRLLGVPQVTADVGTLTICIYPTPTAS